MDYESFIQIYGNHPHWARRLTDCRKTFEGDLRKALAGEREYFREIAVYGVQGEDFALINRDLWRVGVPVCDREFIEREWCIESRHLVDALGDDLDSFLSQAGFGLGDLPQEFDVWRGSDMGESSDQLAASRSWTTSYSAACAFALQNSPWEDERTEQEARDANVPEPIVVMRSVRREQVVAWIGGVEQEVILGRAALALPFKTCGSLPEWRRRR